MSNSVSLQLMQTSNGLGSFSVQSDGYIQGVALDDPSVRNALSGGYLDPLETLPMWGGIAISEYLPATSVGSALGSLIKRATSNAGISGFSVFNQAHGWVNTPQSNVPTAGANQTIPFYRLGSGARIAVACDPSLVSLNGGLTTQQVTWDIAAQRLTPYDAATATYAVTSMTATYDSATGLATIAVVMAVPSLVGAVGDSFTVSGATNSGTGGTAILNTSQIVTSFTDASNFSFQLAVSGSGVIGTIAGTILLTESTGALNVKVLAVEAGNSKIVSYDSINNLANWNDSGTCAVILI